MAKSATYAAELLELYFNATPIATVADNAASSPITHVIATLHTADPSGGNQSTNEVTVPGYTRASVVRTSGGFVITAAVVTGGVITTPAFANPVATISFGTPTGGSGTANYVGFGDDATGAGPIRYSGLLSPPLVLGSGIPLNISSATTISEL
jgi:hypothetical protein